MLCFGRVCASPCTLNVSAALQGAYITPFPAKVVRAIRAQRDEAYVSKIVCYLHVMALNPHLPPWRAPHLHHFYFTSPQPIRPKEASDSDFTIEDAMLRPCMRFSLRSQCKRYSAGRLQIDHSQIQCVLAIHKVLAIVLWTFSILFFTSIQNSVFKHIPSPSFLEPGAVSLMHQYKNRFYSNADHTRCIRKGRDATKSDACAKKTHRTHAVCI